MLHGSGKKKNPQLTITKKSVEQPGPCCWQRYIIIIAWAFFLYEGHRTPPTS